MNDIVARSSRLYITCKSHRNYYTRIVPRSIYICVGSNAALLVWNPMRFETLFGQSFIPRLWDACCRYWNKYFWHKENKEYWALATNIMPSFPFTFNFYYQLFTTPNAIQLFTTPNAIFNIPPRMLLIILLLDRKSVV